MIKLDKILRMSRDDDSFVSPGEFIKFGDQDTDGSFRVGVISGKLTIQERAAGTWETIEEFEHVEP